MMSHLLIFLLLCAITMQAATIFDLFWPQATYASYIIQAGILLFFLAIGLRGEQEAQVFSGLALLAYLFAAHLLFAHYSREPKNFNAIAAYLPLLSFVAFARSYSTVPETLRIFTVVVAVYVLIYVVGHNFILHADFGPSRSIHTGDSERGARLYLAAAFASFLGFRAVIDKRIVLPVRIGLFALAIAAIWFSGFRTFLALFLLVLVLSSLKLTGLLPRVALFVCVMLVSLVLMAGLVVPGWNPFDLMASSDGSAYARSIEYRYAIAAIQQHWLFGIGIPSNFSALQTYLDTPLYEPLYPTDLGILGPIVLLGIPGLVAFVAATYFCIVPRIPQFDEPELRALRLNCIVCGLQGVISPAIILEQNAVFLALLYAGWLRTRPSGSIRDVFRNYRQSWFFAPPVRWSRRPSSGGAIGGGKRRPRQSTRKPGQSPVRWG